MEAVNSTLFLVVNVETTCDVTKRLDPREVIELSAVAIDRESLVIKGDFQRYVRPEVNPELTAKSTRLN